MPWSWLALVGSERSSGVGPEMTRVDPLPAEVTTWAPGRRLLRMGGRLPYGDVGYATLTVIFMPPR